MSHVLKNVPISSQKFSHDTTTGKIFHSFSTYQFPYVIKDSVGGGDSWSSQPTLRAPFPSISDLQRPCAEHEPPCGRNKTFVSTKHPCLIPTSSSSTAL